MNNPIPRDYGNILGDIKERIRSAQYAALRAVNKQLIGLYWDIGRMIVERQARDGWGRAVVEQLATDLQTEFPGIQGFSALNIWRMRKLYETYCHDEKLSPMVTEIGWTHNQVILQKCKDEIQREFYIRMTGRFGWTRSILTQLPAPEQVSLLMRDV